MAGNVCRVLCHDLADGDEVTKDERVAWQCFLETPGQQMADIGDGE
jgi:hypothetical protein